MDEVPQPMNTTKKSINRFDVDHKYVVCGRDCNKHESVIFACFDSMEECITYLNKKGQNLKGKTFDIDVFKISEEDQQLSMFNATFEHKELFEYLSSMSGMRARCTHEGAIHIACIDRYIDFSEIYEWLSETYM
jgi:hypothetical protein